MRFVRSILPLLVLAIGVVGFLGLLRAKRAPEQVARPALPPLVRVVPVQLETVRLKVRSLGEVRPTTSTLLVSQVAGRVVEVSEKLAAGAFFEEGEMLARIDPTDYRFARTEAAARVTQAELRLAIEEREASNARRDWENLGRGEADPLVLREPQLEEARAALASAKAALEKADVDLERTRVRAPYPGRVNERSIDLGQFVSPGTPIGRVDSIESAEVRLPVSADDLAYLDLSLGVPRTDRGGARVHLQADFAGVRSSWVGHVDRTESRIDPATRMLHVVARVEDPFGVDVERGVPLTSGLFVEAQIEGREVDHVAVLPRGAIRPGDRVLVVDAGKRLRSRSVDVLRYDGEQVLIESGLSSGELVSVSALEVAVEGMEVRVDEVAEVSITATNGDER